MSLIRCGSANRKFLLVESSNNTPEPRYDLNLDGFNAFVSDNPSRIKEIWDGSADEQNIFLRSDYLNALHCHPSPNLSFRYVLVFKDNKPVGVVYIQIYFVRMEDSINKEKIEKPRSLLHKIGNPIKNWFVKKAVFNVLICGNLLLTGKHGYYFLETEVDEKQGTQLAKQSVDLVQALFEKESGKKIHVHMFKDYPCKDRNSPIEKELVQSGYYSYTIQPSMYMNLPEKWTCFDDYLEEMQSKYRVRARRAAKKGEELSKKELSLEDVIHYNSEIYTLYKGIANNVGFNAFTLHPEYFLALKKNLGDRIKITGIFKEDCLVAFFTALYNGDILEAHFLGFDHELNKEYQIYLNILYALIDIGIQSRMKTINFARTALEIKSSVGAVPCDLNIYAKHRNKLSSGLMKFIFEYLTPDEVWQQRSPFKDTDLVV
jgi:predicted N-acyltransferase